MSGRRAAARVLTVGAGLVALGSTALFGLRFVPPDAVPVSSDTVAMATAFTDFAGPGFLGATALALGAVVLRRRRARVVLAAICVLATVTQVVLLAPRWVGASIPPTRTTFTVIELNTRLGRADSAEIARAAALADLVVLTEVTASQAQALAKTGFAARYPYRNTGKLPAQGGAGTAVYSRFPVTRTERLSRHLGHQNWVCTVALPGTGPVEVIAVHPARPYRGGTRWLPEQRELAATLPTAGRRLLVGDFNAVASHPSLRALGDAGWRSAVDQAGAGWTPTYPADSGVPPMIDIDHAYVSAGLQATHVETVRVAGTDHLGLLVTIDVTSG